MRVKLLLTGREKLEIGGVRLGLRKMMGVIVTGIGACAGYYQVTGFLFLGGGSEWNFTYPPHPPPKKKQRLSLEID